ncbi:hypothetical protein [Solimonas aquatica]|uniref:hypothetical protein n=1 Tax=Solimonas aquatica TaxID=489703 RepID=UPI000B825CC2|nr:hypothetical protein [Solimonas aquatica]
MLRAVPVRQQSFLGAYAKRGAFTDCYAVEVPEAIILQDFIEAFYTTPLFKIERWLLARFLKIESTDSEAVELAHGRRSVFSAWKVEQRSGTEILLSAGQTRSWLSIAPGGAGKPATSLLFGSAVVPMRPGGKFGLAFHALLGLHRVYSKLLLGAAAKRVKASQSPTT